MPDSVIRHVENYGKDNALPGIFDFANKSGVLFEWNEEVDECPKGILKEENIILYPLLAAELLGVVLGQDMPRPSIKADLTPQGCVEDEAAQNANHQPFNVIGVDQPVAAHVILHAKDGKIDSNNDKDNDDCIIAINNAPLPQMAQESLVLPDSSEDKPDNNSNDGKDDNNDTPSIGNAVIKQTESGDDEDKEQKNQGVRQSRHRNKGVNHQYNDYTLMMHRRSAARGGQQCTTICNGVCFFLAEDLSNAKPVPEADREEYALGVALVTYGIGPGIKKFQEWGEAGVMKELMQMHNMDVFCPVMRNNLTWDKRKKALASLMFLKEKRDQLVKAQMCADGRGQQGDWSKQNTTSPTISTKSVFITAVINVHEGQDIACFNILGAFLHVDLDKDIIMILKGWLAELMVQLAPNLYRKYISVDRKGKAILYMKMQKAIYGLLRSALLFYRKLVADLESSGFVINPYDPCVANKVINGKQMTVFWHVDDLKVSQLEPDEVTKFGNWLSKTYGVSVATHQGKIHDYLGMIFDFLKEGKVMVNMIEYIKTIIGNFPEEIIATHASPAADHLFTVRDKTKAMPLPEEQACAFHHVTAQVLFLSARARRNIQPCTAFVTTRVKSPDEDDWGKLKRLLGYLKGTLHMPLVLLVDSLTLSCWWVDAAYAVHSNMKGHTGAGMSFGQGMALSYSWKYKIMTKSLTEAELVGVNDSLGYILWARYFMQAQGYEMEASLLYQDNMSAMLLKMNGKASS
jgi:hypothetical protein